MSTTQHLLSEIEAFLEARDMRATEFGLLSVNDGHVVRDLRAGIDMRASRIDRIRAFMRNYRAAPRRRKSQGAAA